MTDVPGPTNPNWVTVGKLSFPKTARLAAKGVEVFVFQGTYQHNGIHPCTIKRALKTLEVVDKKRLKELKHPNVVRHYVTEQDDDYFYIATEPSQDTLEVVALKGYEGPPIGTNKEILAQLTEGLVYMHELGFIHGNINPQSCVICIPDGSPSPSRPSSRRSSLVNGPTGRRMSTTSGPPSRKTSSVNAPNLRRESTIADLDDTTPTVKLANFEIIGGREGWIAPEYDLDVDKICQNSDVFSLGIVFAYLLYNGQHPFGPIHLQQSNILFGYYHLSEEKLNDPMAVDLVRRMLEPDSDKRISAQGVLAHPWFWDSEQSIQFITRVADQVLKPALDAVAAGGEPDPWVFAMNAEERSIVRGYWKQFLTPCVRKLIDRRSYDASTLVGLLMAIRDKAVQYADQSPEVKAEFGGKPDGYLIYWTSRFPDLLLYAYKKYGHKVSLPR